MVTGADEEPLLVVQYSLGATEKLVRARSCSYLHCLVLASTSSSLVIFPFDLVGAKVINSSIPANTGNTSSRGSTRIIMMLKAEKLRAPLSSILQRTPLTSYSTTSRLSPTYQTSHHLATSNPQNPSPSSSTTTTVADINHHFLGYPFKISGNSFCSQSSQKINTNRCWNCNAEPQSALFLVCDSCRTIQPVDHSVNYFEIFGLDKKYEIEDRNLEGKYKDWQKKLHPDLVHSKSEKEREFAAEQSARVIDAYRTLSNSLARAIYIMKLEGVDVDEEETISEPELLSEIMEIREAVEEAPDSQALNEIKSLMQEKLQHWANSFANAFHSLKFEEAVTCIRRMTYYDRVNEEIVKRL